MKKEVLLFSALFSLAGPVVAMPVTFNAFEDFTTGAGNNNAGATWQFLAAKYGWQNSQATYLPDYGYRDYSTATQINDNNSLGLTIPRGERHVWKSNYTYTGSVTYDTGIEWSNSNFHIDPDGDGAIELVEHIHMSPGFTGVSGQYQIADTLLAFSPDINEQTLFNFNFDVASDYDINGAADCNNCLGSGQRLGLFLNDGILSPDLFWSEDNDAGNGSKITGGNYDGWVLLPSAFARFDEPIAMDFDLLMNPGDTFYLRLNNNGYTQWDGLILTEAVATANPSGGSATHNVPEPGTLFLMLAAVPLLFRGKQHAGKPPANTGAGRRAMFPAHLSA